MPYVTTGYWVSGYAEGDIFPHLVGISDSQQVNTGIAASISQSSITFVAAADSIQINQADAATIRQTHLVGVASSQQINTAAAAAIAQTASGSILIADSQQINQSSTGSILQIHRVSVAHSQQTHQGSAASISSGSLSSSLSDADIARIVAALPSAEMIAAAVMAAIKSDPDTLTVHKFIGLQND